MVDLAVACLEAIGKIHTVHFNVSDLARHTYTIKAMAGGTGSLIWAVFDESGSHYVGSLLISFHWPQLMYSSLAEHNKRYL
jgi:hypothetical protein